MKLKSWVRSMNLNDLELKGIGYKLDSKTFCTNSLENAQKIIDFFNKFENTLVWLQMNKKNNYEVIIDIED